MVDAGVRGKALLVLLGFQRQRKTRSTALVNMCDLGLFGDISLNSDHRGRRFRLTRRRSAGRPGQTAGPDGHAGRSAPVSLVELGGDETCRKSALDFQDVARASIYVGATRTLAQTMVISCVAVDSYSQQLIQIANGEDRSDRRRCDKVERPDGWMNRLM